MCVRIKPFFVRVPVGSTHIILHCCPAVNMRSLRVLNLTYLQYSQYPFTIYYQVCAITNCCRVCRRAVTCVRNGIKSFDIWKDRSVYILSNVFALHPSPGIPAFLFADITLKASIYQISNIEIVYTWYVFFCSSVSCRPRLKNRYQFQI